MFTTADTIIAIDLGRHKSVAWICARARRLGFDRLQDGLRNACSARPGIFALIQLGWP